MRKYLFFTLLFLQPIFLLSQSKRDQTWIMGYATLIPNEPNNLDYGGMKLNFGEKELKITPFDIFTLAATGCANDENGEMQFYTTGCTIYNNQNEVMENGDDIIIGGENAENRCIKHDAILNLLSSTIILPLPNHSETYLNFQLRLEETSDTTYVCDTYFYSVVDMSQNNGLGKVVEKHLIALEDSLHDAAAAVRHGNGRDWWVVVPRGVNRQFWELLITPEGVKDKILRTLAPQDKYNITYKEADPPFREHLFPEYMFECFAGQATFSPDGTKYARIGFGYGVEIYDFDRCTGELVLRRTIPMPLDSFFQLIELPIQYVGIAISPNSRFLYFTTLHGMFQFDLCAENIEKGNYVKVGYIDGFFDPLFPVSLNFFQMRNTPQGEIFCTPANSSKYIHVIHSPNEPGLKCDFRQHDIHLPRFNYVMGNYFPNFNLYDVKDSPCDTLGIDDPNPLEPLPELLKFTIYPNPVSKELKIFNPVCDEASISVFNMLGQQILKDKMIIGQEVVRLDVSSWAVGTYVFVANVGVGKPIVQKIVVAH